MELIGTLYKIGRSYYPNQVVLAHAVSITPSALRTKIHRLGGVGKLDSFTIGEKEVKIVKFYK